MARNVCFLLSEMGLRLPEPRAFQAGSSTVSSNTAVRQHCNKVKLAEQLLENEMLFSAFHVA